MHCVALNKGRTRKACVQCVACRVGVGGVSTAFLEAEARLQQLLGMLLRPTTQRKKHKVRADLFLKQITRAFPFVILS